LTLLPDLLLYAHPQPLRLLHQQEPGACGAAANLLLVLLLLLLLCRVPLLLIQLATSSHQGVAPSVVVRV